MRYAATLLLALFGLAGCYSFGDIDERPPRADDQTDQTDLEPDLAELTDMANDGEMSCVDSDCGPRARCVSNACAEDLRLHTLAAGTSASCAIQNHVLVCWGDNSDLSLFTERSDPYLHPTPLHPSFEPTPVSVTMGSRFGCVLAGGQVFCWGVDDDGQVGRGDPGMGSAYALSSTDPVVDLDDVVSVSAGTNHACAARSDGRVLCWGNNDSGQLGVASAITPAAATPIDVTEATAGRVDAIVEVAAGNGFTCARTADGDVMCWGRSEQGQSGTDTQDASTAPASVVSSGFGVATSLTAGDRHACLVSDAGQVWCWGDNGYGQSRNASDVDALTPIRLMSPVLSDVAEVAAGEFHTCVRRNNGDLHCLGDNSSFQLGDGSFDGDSPQTAGQRIAVDPAAELTAGAMHSCARFGETELRCWGDNTSQQLGDGFEPRRRVPVPSQATNASHVAVGGTHTCAIVGGDVWCWGDASRSQLGLGTQTPQPAPTLVMDQTNPFDHLVAGLFHTCAIENGRDVWCWGRGKDSQIGVLIGPFETPRLILQGMSQIERIAAGPFHSCWVDTTGAITCWGWNADGQTGSAPGTVNRTIAPTRVFWPSMPAPTIVSLDAGGYYDSVAFDQECAVGECHGHTCVATGNGEAWCWGDNTFGQLGRGVAPSEVPTRVPSLTNMTVEKVCTGAAFTCVLGAVAGTEEVRCFGDNSFGQLGIDPQLVPSTGTPEVLTDSEGDLHCGAHTVCVPKGQGAARRLHCWGRNVDGEIAQPFDVPFILDTNQAVDLPNINGGPQEVSMSPATDGTHMCAIDLDGQVHCWGTAINGQLGDGSYGYSPIPVSVMLP